MLAESMLLGAGDFAPTITYVGGAATSTGSTNTSAFAISPQSTGRQLGDLLIAIISGQANLASVTTPSGWTAVGSLDSGAIRSAVFAKISDGTETSTPIVSSGVANRNGGVWCYRGATSVALVGADNEQAITADALAPGISPVTPGVLLGFFRINIDTRTVSAVPAGMTSRTSNNANHSTALCDLIPSPAGATGDKTLTFSGTGGATCGGFLLQIS